MSSFPKPPASPPQDPLGRIDGIQIELFIIFERKARIFEVYI
jgi:hypothetical protein